MHLGEIQHIRRLRAQLHALDLLLGSVPLQQHPKLDLNAILSEGLADTEIPDTAPTEDSINTGNLDAMCMIVDTVPRFDLIPAILIDIYKKSLQGMMYRNVYRHSDINKSRDPTCSEVLQLLPKLDEELKTSLRDRLNALISKVAPFRFLDLPAELRLQVYSHLLPRLPYLTLVDVKPHQYALPRYDLAPLRTCRQIYTELVEHFYKDQALVINIYEMDPTLGRTRTRDRSIIFSMRKETRSYFKSLEIRLLTCEDPNISRKGSHWAAYTAADDGTMFHYSLKAFPNVETAVVSFELEENDLKYWRGSGHSLFEHVTGWLVLNIPRNIDLRWNFWPTSDPDLEALALEGREMMERVEEAVAEQVAIEGCILLHGKSVAREPIYIDSGFGLPHY